VESALKEATEEARKVGTATLVMLEAQRKMSFVDGLQQICRLVKVPMDDNSRNICDLIYRQVNGP